MTKYVVHIDVGDLPKTMADAHVENIRNMNSNFFGLDDQVFYLPNRKGFSSIETLPQQEKQIYFSNGTEEERNKLQEDFDEFFGYNVIFVVYSAEIPFSTVTVKV